MYTNINAPTINTNRLLIRLVSIYDYKDYYKFCSNSKVCEYLTFNPYNNVCQSKRAIENMIRSYLIGSDVNFSIVNKENNKVIGSISLTFSKHTNSADVGYILDEDYWNQKIMSEALNEIINIAFNYYKLDYLTASYIKENMASDAILRKFRFNIYDVVKNGFIKNNNKYDLVKCVLTLNR